MPRPGPVLHCDYFIVRLPRPSGRTTNTFHTSCTLPLCRPGSRETLQRLCKCRLLLLLLLSHSIASICNANVIIVTVGHVDHAAGGCTDVPTMCIVHCADMYRGFTDVPTITMYIVQFCTLRCNVYRLATLPRHSSNSAGGSCAIFCGENVSCRCPVDTLWCRMTSYHCDKWLILKVLFPAHGVHFR